MRAALFFFTVLAACAQPPTHGAQDSVVPGTIGVAVRAERSSVIVEALAKSGPAARSGVRAGDVVLRFNGEQLDTVPRV